MSERERQNAKQENETERERDREKGRINIDKYTERQRIKHRNAGKDS